MSAILTRALLGLALLAGAAAWPAPARDGAADAELHEPLALALAPLGPVKAVVLAGLWVEALDRHAEGDVERVVLLARTLLDLYPGADAVREFLARELLVTEAARAPDEERRLAVLRAGLLLLEDGLAGRRSPRLSSALGRTLALRRDLDPLLAEAVRTVYGAHLEDVALEALAQGAEPSVDGPLRVGLRVERGLRRLRLGEGRGAAAVELRRAEALLDSLPPEIVAGHRLHEALDELRDAMRESEDGIPPGEGLR